VLVAEDPGRQVHVVGTDAVEHRVAQLDIAVRGDRATKRALIICTTREVAVDHGVGALLSGDAKVVDVGCLLNAPRRWPVQEGHHRWLDGGEDRT